MRLNSLSEMSATDALYGIMAWLTCRNETLELGAKHTCPPAVEVITKFIDANGLEGPSKAYPDNIKFPKE